MSLVVIMVVAAAAVKAKMGRLLKSEVDVSNPFRGLSYLIVFIELLSGSE